MKFRDAEQRARVCRALLTAAADHEIVNVLWTRQGPTELACTIMHKGFYAPILQQHPARMQALRLAWDVWNGEGRFFTLDAIKHWDARAWEVFASFCEALADDAAHVEDDYRAAVPIPDMPGAVPVGHYEMAMSEETALDAWVRSVETEYEWRKVDEE